MSSASARPVLDRRDVLVAAIACADEEGLDATSMRRLADRLGVTPMALYKHVGNREGLVDGMLDLVIEGIDPGGDGGDWRDALRRRILSARVEILRHPWAVGAIEARTSASAVVLAHMDALIGIMRRGGFSLDLVHDAMHALSTRMWGFTREVFPTPAVPADPDARAAMLARFAVEYPNIVAMATQSSHAGVACDADAEFVFALDLLLDGFERLRLAQGDDTAPG